VAAGLEAAGRVPGGIAGRAGPRHGRRALANTATGRLDPRLGGDGFGVYSTGIVLWPPLDLHVQCAAVHTNRSSRPLEAAGLVPRAGIRIVAALEHLATRRTVREANGASDFTRLRLHALPPRRDTISGEGDGEGRVWLTRLPLHTLRIALHRVVSVVRGTLPLPPHARQRSMATTGTPVLLSAGTGLPCSSSRKVPSRFTTHKPCVPL
jgi:hypothetical protein